MKVSEMIALSLANPISQDFLLSKINKLIKNNIKSENDAKNKMLIIKLSEIIDIEEIKKIEE
jgi:hypothetical protein